MWDDDDEYREEEYGDDEYRQEQQRVENLPIVKKANELFELVNALIETFDLRETDPDKPFTDPSALEDNLQPEEEFDEEDAEELDEEEVVDIAESYKGMMMEDVMMINVKLRGAEAGDLYSLRMENAVIIKIHANSLLTATSALKMMGLSNNKYLQLLRDEIEEFRKLFVLWVQGFDRTNDAPDSWGLFNQKLPPTTHN